MKTLLIDPKRLKLESYLCTPSVGLAYLAAAMLRAGHEVSVCSAARDGLGPERVADEADKGDFSLIGLSIFTPFFHSAARYAAQIRLRMKGRAILVAGGPHAIFEPEELLRRIPVFDYAVTGEGEETLPALAALLERRPEPSCDELRQIPNLAFRDGDRISVTPRAFIDDIRPLDQPAWDLIRPDLFSLNINGIFSKTKKVAPIITSRGCPYPCKFCGAGLAMGKKARHRDPDSVVEEMAMLKRDYGIEEFHIEDDNFIAVREMAVRICEKIIRAGLNVVWAIPPGIRLDQIDGEMAALMRRAGCYLTSVGIESGSQRALDAMNKKLDRRIVAERVDLLRRNGIEVTGLFIFGYPGETYSEMRETIRMALRLKLNRANFFNFTPFPGSRIYDGVEGCRQA